MVADPPPRPADIEHRPERGGLRWQLVAGVLVLLTMVLLGGGVLVARRLQTEAATAPTGASVRVGASMVTAAPTAIVRVATPVVVNGAVGTATATPAATLRAPEQSTPQSTQQGASIELTPVIIALSSGTPRVLSSDAPPTPEPTPQEWWARNDSAIDPALRDELEQAYSRFWTVRIQAVLNLDPTPFDDVMAGEVLDRERASLDDLRAQGQTQQAQVEHNAHVMYATPDDAAIFDEYVSHTTPFDAATNDQLGPTTSGSGRLAYHFLRIGGIWKVVEAVQLVYDN